MRPAVVGAMVGAAVGIAAVQWSCWVERPTDTYQCTSQAMCNMGRVCEMGYCVIDPRVKLDAAADAYIPDSPMCPLICNGELINDLYPRSLNFDLFLRYHNWYFNHLGE